MKRASELKLIYALLPLQLGIVMCYQYETAYFPAPYVDTSCFAASAAQSRVTPLILRVSNTTTTWFSSRSSNFCSFTARIHQKRSQKVRNPSGACPQTPLAGALCALKSHTGTSLFKIIDPPLVMYHLSTVVKVLKQTGRQEMDSWGIISVTVYNTCSRM